MQSTTEAERKEDILRIEIGRDIIYAGNELNLKFLSVGTCLVFCHRYINFKHHDAIKSENPIVLLAALLFLACKATEVPRSIRDCFFVSFQRYQDKLINISEKDMQYEVMKESIIGKEHAILRILGFDVFVELPTSKLFSFARKQRYSSEIIDMGLEFLNDCFLRKESIETDNNVIACTCLLMAAHLNGDDSIVDKLRADAETEADSRIQGKWWREYAKSEDILHLMDQITDLNIGEVEE